MLGPLPLILGRGLYPSATSGALAPSARSVALAPSARSGALEQVLHTPFKNSKWLQKTKAFRGKKNKLKFYYPLYTNTVKNEGGLERKT